jgi:membrane fusion protein (multidrug efflux system)
VKSPATQIASLLLLLAPSALLVGCGGNKTDAAELEKTEVDEAVPVEVAVLATGPIESVLRASTNLEAESSVRVLAEAARRVVALRVEEGDTVRAGQVLVRLEDDAQRTGLARTRSQLERARVELARQEDLFQKALVSEKAYKDARYELEQLELALADAERELSYTEVRASISGTVTQRLVKLGDAVSPGQELFEIVDFDSLVARIFVPERELARIAEGQAVRLVAEASGGASFSGRVERISPVVDPKTGTVKVTVEVPRAVGLRPGMFLEAELVTAVRNDAVLVPKRALVLDGSSTFVYRVRKDGTVEKVPVVAALEARDRIAVDSGLAVGDQVVVAGQAGLDGDAKVRVLGGDRGNA